MQPDVVVYSPRAGLQLVVEVKSQSGASDEWARQVRRNLLAHGFVPATPYFLLVLPDHVYLWKNTDLASIDSSPDFKLETPTVLADYLPMLSRPLHELSGPSLELLVNSWLANLVNTTHLDLNDPSQQWIIESGLYDAIKSGSVVTDFFA
jgi:hypothetical protein